MKHCNCCNDLTQHSLVVTVGKPFIYEPSHSTAHKWVDFYSMKSKIKNIFMVVKTLLLSLITADCLTSRLCFLFHVFLLLKSVLNCWLRFSWTIQLFYSSCLVHLSISSVLCKFAGFWQLEASAWFNTDTNRSRNCMRYLIWKVDTVDSLRMRRPHVFRYHLTEDWSILHCSRIYNVLRVLSSWWSLCDKRFWASFTEVAGDFMKIPAIH